VLRQPKRLGLLAYLFLAGGPGRFHRRDRLLSLFWPDREPALGRGALRQALSFLSRHLGPEILVRRGLHEVALDPIRVDCDAWRFQLAVHQGRLESAMSEYRGPLLDGLYLSGSQEFDQWLEPVRLDFQARAGAVAWELCGRAMARGYVDGVSRWGHRALELSALDEDCVHWLMHFLARHGDRAGALRVFRRLEDHLQALELSPSDPTLALVAEIRSSESRAGRRDSDAPHVVGRRAFPGPEMDHPVGRRSGDRRAGGDRRGGLDRRRDRSGSPALSK
jgi:DNA-binding SARP family transcriptional activator